MIEKIKDYLNRHQEQYELIRYVIAGGLTTVLSMVISYGCCFLFAPKTPMEGSLIPWVIATINQATAPQVMVANGISWVISVLFAFWINRKMVFQVQGGGANTVVKELVQFALGRVLSFVLFEEGMALLLNLIGISNIFNRMIVLVFVMIFNYVISKFWVFKETKEGDNTPATQEAIQAEEKQEP